MELSLIIYAIILFCIFKFIKNELLEVIAILLLTFLCKVIAEDGSFYPLFCMPVLLGLRYKKPYTIVYTVITILFVSSTQGFGIWTIGQLAIYGMIIGITYFARKQLNKNKLVALSYNFVIMFVFGVLMDVFTFYAGNFLGYPNVFSQILGGLPFDLKYGLSGLMYGSISMAVAYLSSVKIEDIFTVRKMKLDKV